jgi:hypothetical protein
MFFNERRIERHLGSKYKENEEEHSIAIPKDVLQTALTQGWFPKRGSER